MKKRFIKILPAVIVLVTILPFLCSCKATEADALSIYDGVAHNVYRSDTNRYGFFHEECAYDEEGNVWGFELYVSDKDKTNTRKIPAFPTIINSCVRRLFVTDNYVYLVTQDENSFGYKIERIDPIDYSTEVLYNTSGKIEKAVFGLAFSDERIEKERGTTPDFVFSNDRDVFFSDHDKGVFKVLPDKTAKNIISDKMRYDVIYDGEYIFYVTMEGALKKYEIRSGRTEILAETVTPYTVKVTKEDITFESDGEKVTISR